MIVEPPLCLQGIESSKLQKKNKNGPSNHLKHGEDVMYCNNELIATLISKTIKSMIGIREQFHGLV